MIVKQRGYAHVLHIIDEFARNTCLVSNDASVCMGMMTKSIMNCCSFAWYIFVFFFRLLSIVKQCGYIRFWHIIDESIKSACLVSDDFFCVHECDDKVNSNKSWNKWLGNNIWVNWWCILVEWTSSKWCACIQWHDDKVSSIQK